MDEKSGIEKSGVERSEVEKSGVEMSFNPCGPISYFGRSVKPYFNHGQIMPLPSEFSDLPTALSFPVFSYLAIRQMTANSPTYVASPRGWK